MLVLFFRTVFIYFSLLFFMRLTGKRQIGQMELSELILAFLLSELATAPLSNLNTPLTFALIPIGVLVSFEVLLSFLATKSVFLKRVLDGTPSILIRHGVPDEAALLRARISVEELLGQMRLKGFSHLDQIAYALLEHNGQISFLATDAAQAVDARTMQLSVTERGTDHLLIVDGRVSKTGLALIGKTEGWLVQKLCERGVFCVSEVFLCSVDDAGTFTLIPKQKKEVGK